MKRPKKQRRKKLFPGPLDPGYFEPVARAAKHDGNTDSARLLLESFREPIRHRRPFDPAVLRHLYRAFTAILDYERDAGNALLLSKRRRGRPDVDPAVHLRLAIAVKAKLDGNPTLSLKAAFGEVEIEQGASLATVERAWREYGRDVQKLLPSEIKASHGSEN